MDMNQQAPQYGNLQPGDRDWTAFGVMSWSLLQSLLPYVYSITDVKEEGTQGLEVIMYRQILEDGEEAEGNCVMCTARPQIPKWLSCQGDPLQGYLHAAN